MNREVNMYYTEDEAGKLVIEAGHKLSESGLIARTWGNVSARISADEFIITPSGRSYDSIGPRDLVVVKVKDASYEGDIKPSSERKAHASAYSLRSDVSFIIHTHQYYASAIAADCKDTDFTPCAEYGLPGTDKLKKNLERSIKANPGKREFLMARHGAIILGNDFDDAFGRASELEEKCKALVEARIPSHDYTFIEDFDASQVSITALPHVKVVSDPYILECCKAGRTVGAYIDDFAMIVGHDMPVVDNDPWMAERALLGYSLTKPPKAISNMPMTGVLPRMGGQQPVLNSLIGRNAVLVKGVGAVCAGKTASDAEAIAMIVSKNCCAACYARNAKPLSAIDARLQRYGYLTSYSKRIEA